MKLKFYLILCLAFTATQYSYGQFIDYIPLQNNNSYEVERDIRSTNEFYNSLNRKWEDDVNEILKRSKAERASQPVIINEELITATGMNIMQEKEVKAKINQKIYSDGQVVLFIIGLKCDDKWISVKETLLPKISTLIKKAEYDGEDEVKEALLEVSEYANYICVINNEYVVF